MKLELRNLKGTEKQIAWATQIRETELKKLTDKFDMMMQDPKAAADKAGMTAMKESIEAVAAHEQAAWWIDNKDCIRVRLQDEYMKRRTRQ